MRNWGWKRSAHWVQSVILETKTRQWVKKKVKSDSLKCSRLLASLSLSLPFPLYHSLLLSLCVFFWNRPSVMSTEISRHSAGASAGLTFPLPVIYIRGEAHGGFSMPAVGGGAVMVVVVVVVWGGGASTPGLVAVRHSNNGGTDHPAERCFYCKENLHDCIQARLLKCHHPPSTAHTSDSNISGLF